MKSNDIDKLKEMIRTIFREVTSELDEMTATGNISGYSTPYAFKKKGKKGKKLKLK